MRISKIGYMELFLSELEEFALLAASLCHDIGHVGVNNPFLVETANELALRYNDKSPLENMHCSRIFEIVAQPEANILVNLARDQFKEARQHIIEVILHTDMMHHFTMVKDINVLYSMNEESFPPTNPDEPPDPSETDLFRTSDTKKMMLNMVLHSADISNPCKPWRICRVWALAVLEEFFAQGDQEKALGIPVQMLNDRDKVNRPNSQIGFIEFIVAPFAIAQAKLFPACFELVENLEANLACWEKEWHEMSNPPAEEREKVVGRLQKISANVKEAKKRKISPNDGKVPEGARRASAWAR